MRRLRPFGFALLFLLLFECVLRAWLPPDLRVQRDVRNPFGCFADDELLRLEQAREQDIDALDVVLVGDSVLASVENGPGEKLVDLLPQVLSQRLATASSPYANKKVRVFSISMSAARAADQQAALTVLHKRLSVHRKGLRDLVVVVSSNILFFSKRFASDAMSYPCLSYALVDDPLLLRKLAVPSPQKGLWGDSDAFLSRALSHLYLFQQRRHLAEALVGGPLRPQLREKLTRALRRLPGHTPQPAAPQVIDAEVRNRPWFLRDHKRESFTAHYDYVPTDSPQAFNFIATRSLFAFLAAHPELPAFVMINPHNHHFIGPLGQTDSYRALMQQIKHMAAAHGLYVADYDRQPALRSEHFLDIDHFTRDGNAALSALIAEDVLRVLSARSQGT